MCSCDFNFTCHLHREPNPDVADGDDPYNDQPDEPHVSEFEVAE